MRDLYKEYTLDCLIACAYLFGCMAANDVREHACIPRPLSVGIVQACTMVAVDANA